MATTWGQAGPLGEYQGHMPVHEVPHKTRLQTRRAAQQAPAAVAPEPAATSAPPGGDDPGAPGPRRSQRKRVREDNKENIAPVRSVSQSTLAIEAADASGQQRPDDRNTRVSRRRVSPRSETAVQRVEETEDEREDDELSQPSIPIPSTPRRRRPPTPCASAHKQVLYTPPKAMPETPAGTPTKTDPSLYARARALLRDASDSGSTIVGRAAERATVHAFLDNADGEHSGCMYVSGMPGTGKTALIRAVVEERSSLVALVNCVALSSPSQVAGEVMRAIGASGSPPVDDLSEALGNALGSRRLVIVLDELDHLLHTRVHQNVLYRLFCLPL